MMKVDVLQVEDATFKYKWSLWSNWIDVAMYDYGCTPFPLQMRVSRFNRKQFRNTCISGAIRYRQTSCSTIGDLTGMKRGEA